MKNFKTKKAAKNKVNRIAKNKNQYYKGTKYNKTRKTYTVKYSEFVPKKRRK